MAKKKTTTKKRKTIKKAKVKHQGKRLWVGRNNTTVGVYVCMAGASPYLHTGSGTWRMLPGGVVTPARICARSFEAACPHLKLKPGEIVEIELKKKGNAIRFHRLAHETAKTEPRVSASGQSTSG